MDQECVICGEFEYARCFDCREAICEAHAPLLPGYTTLRICPDCLAKRPNALGAYLDLAMYMAGHIGTLDALLANDLAEDSFVREQLAAARQKFQTALDEAREKAFGARKVAA